MTSSPSDKIGSNGATSRRVKIVVQGRQAFVGRSHAAMIEPLLTATARVAVPDERSGHSWKVLSVALGDDATHGRIDFSAGFVPRVVEALRRAGHEVRVLDRTRWMPEPAPDLELLEYPCPVEQELFGKLIHCQFGQIIYCTATEQAKIIAGITDFLPTARILVITCGVQDARRLARKIDKYVERPREVQSHAQQPWHSANRCLVETASKFAILCVPDAWDVILFADRRAAIMPTSLRSLAGFLQHCRTYALVPAGQPMDDLRLLQLELAAGGVLYTLPSARREQIPTDFIMVMPPQSPMCNQKLSALDRKRAAIWHNEQRNRAVVEIAQGLAVGDREVLWRHGIFLTAEDESSGKARKRRVAIYVESLEHASKLEKLLLMAGGRPLSGGGQDANKPRRKTMGRIHVVTATKAYDREMTADVLVRADGTADPLSPLRWRPACGDQPRLVVDFRDDWDGQAVRDTARRLTDYSSAGWTTGQSIAHKPGTLNQSQPARQEPAREDRHLEILRCYHAIA